MTPFCCVSGGGDQENTTSLSLTSTSNISGTPDGAVAHKCLQSVCLFQTGSPGSGVRMMADTGSELPRAPIVTILQLYLVPG